MAHRLPSSATRAETRVIFAGLRSLARRRLRRVQIEAGSRRFGAIDSSSYGNIVTMLLLLMIVETPATHIILGALMQPSAIRAVVRALLVGSSVYLAVWLLGDLRLLRESPGVLLGQDLLRIELGQRVNGVVPLSNVTHAELVVPEVARSSQPANAIRITPHAQPNCRIHMRSPVSMRGLFGRVLHGVKLDIYVDDPDALVAAIEAASTR